MIEVADDDCGFSRLQPLNLAVVTGSDEVVRKVIDGKARHVPRAAIGEMSGRFESQACLRLKEHGFRRNDDQLCQSRLVLAKAHCSAAQPGQQNRVLLRVPLEPNATLMGNLSRCLLQNQAALRVQQVYSPPSGVPGQRPMVKSRVFSSQRQLEASFAVLVPVAGTQIAAGLGEHGHHVVAERDRFVASRQSSRHCPRTCREQEPRGEKAELTEREHVSGGYWQEGEEGRRTPSIRKPPVKCNGHESNVDRASATAGLRCRLRRDKLYLCTSLFKAPACPTNFLAAVF